MKITKQQIIDMIREELQYIHGNGENYGLPASWARKIEEDSAQEEPPHLAEMEALKQQILALSYDLIDKLGGSSEIQEAQDHMQDAARAVHGAMEAIRYSLEQQGLSERTRNDSK